MEPLRRQNNVRYGMLNVKRCAPYAVRPCSPRPERGRRALPIGVSGLLTLPGRLRDGYARIQLRMWRGWGRGGSGRGGPFRPLPPLPWRLRQGGQVKQPELRKALNGVGEDMCSTIQDAVRPVVKQAEDGEQGQLTDDSMSFCVPGPKRDQFRRQPGRGGFLYKTILLFLTRRGEGVVSRPGLPG